jgi:hypothetical protein
MVAGTGTGARKARPVRFSGKDGNKIVTLIGQLAQLAPVRVSLNVYFFAGSKNSSALVLQSTETAISPQTSLPLGRIQSYSWIEVVI